MVITSSTEVQTPAPSPARLATPQTDISTESGLNTGNPDTKREIIRCINNCSLLTLAN